MKRKFYLVLLLALAPTIVNALGLGKLDLKSALNEPFEARIQLLSPSADELDSLNVGLADGEAFARAKLERPFILSNLKFALRRSVDESPDYIRVFSSEPIREPFLNFLVEVNWSNGRLYREYTVLLDPPLYDPSAKETEFKKKLESQSVSSTEQEVTEISEPELGTVYHGGYEEQTSSPATVSSAIDYSGGDYGPTSRSDTLWSIASAMRPDRSISVNRMMLALLRTNPDAFFNQNINGLKRGQILRMPNESEINALSNAEALAEVQSQYAVWDGVKDNFSSSVSERPEVSSVPEAVETEAEETSSSVQEVVETDPELKLVAANDGSDVTQQAASVDEGAGENLILAQESIQALTQENIELKDQLQESEAILQDLKRLLSLKDDELAALQEQMAAGSVEMPSEEVTEEEAVEEMAEEVIEEEPVEEMAEEVMEEAPAEEVVDEAIEEVIEEEPVEEMAEEVTEEAPAEEVVEEEVIEVIEEPAPATGVMAMVEQYLGPVKEILLGNPIIGMAVGGVLLVLILVVVLLKFRKEPAETMDINAPTEEAFPDFSSGDLGDTGEEVPDSEAVTVLPDSEAETAVADEAADLGTEEEEEEKTEFVETQEVPVEEEPEDDPLQEVNTYLAFEQFDQAEELVRNAINDEPDNPEYHTKLLEVFYTSGNKKAYEEAAKVLHDKVGGEGEHWDMATAMWQEMSPNRALFEAGEDDDDDDADNTGGFVDVTADDEAADSGAGDLDFDIGGAEETPVEDTPEEGSSDDVLDLTASDDSEDVLDISGAGADSEDLLDVTAAVGLDDEAEIPDPTAADDVLDISGGGAGGDDLLDFTVAEDASGEDLLDVTAAANLEPDSEEDLLDVTAATSAGADSSELLDIEPEGLATEGAVDGEAETIEFDVAGTDNAVAEESVTDDNVIDFDMTASASDAEETDTGELDVDAGELEIDMGDSDVELDVAAEEEEPIRLDIEGDTAEAGSDDDLSLDFDMGEAEASDDISLELDTASNDSEGEIAMDLDVGSDEGIELDLSTAEDDLSIDAGEAPELDISLEIDNAEPETTEPETAELDATVDDMDFDLSFDVDDEDAAASDDIDLEGTVQMPKTATDELDDDDDDDEHTVFVPRAAQPEEQSAEDEVATKLDLAKAYVELGDKDSAKNILDEVMAEGNDEQKKQAEELLGQV